MYCRRKLLVSSKGINHSLGLNLSTNRDLPLKGKARLGLILQKQNGLTAHHS